MKLSTRKFLKAALCMALAFSMAFPFPVMAEYDYKKLAKLRTVELKDGMTVNIKVGETVALLWHDKHEKLQWGVRITMPQQPLYQTYYGLSSSELEEIRELGRIKGIVEERERERKLKEEEKQKKELDSRLGLDKIVSIDDGMYSPAGGIEDIFREAFGRPKVSLATMVVTGLDTGIVTWDLNEENPMNFRFDDKNEHVKFTLVVGDISEPEPDEPAPEVKDGWLNAEAINAGVKLSWSPEPGGVGYRLYRSEDPDGEDVSLTDYPVICTEFVDVNVRPDTTYYYSLRQILSQPEEDLPEELATFVGSAQVKTRAEILGDNLPAGEKKFILLAIDDTNMNVDGINRENDAAPVLRNGYTMVPIRGIVEGMGGKVGWGAATGEISIDCRNVGVRMWKDKTDITVNGAQKRIDAAPTAINGRTMVPLRFVAEGLGCAINWLDGTKQIVIVY